MLGLLLLDGVPEDFVLGLSDSMGTGGKPSPLILPVASGLSGVGFDLRRGFSRIWGSSTCGGLRPEIAGLRVRWSEGSNGLTSCEVTGTCDATCLAAGGGSERAGLLLKKPIERRGMQAGGP